MFFEQRIAKESSLSYFFGCAGKAVAVAVDVVAGDEDWFKNAAMEAKVSITHVIDTHVHADHLSGGRALAETIGAEYCLHEYNLPLSGFNFTPLSEGDEIEVGNVIGKVIHAPGHSPDSICLSVTDKRRGAEPWFLITGDTLFVGSVGRPDLAGDKVAMARALFDSIHRKILPLPDFIEIYPGHKSGSACGASLSGKPVSTIGFEKRWNPLLSLNEDEFVREITSGIPAPPLEATAIVETNLGRGTS